MSGPPPYVDPASNAIGTFVIGVSPIGTIPSFDVWTTIIEQYANSPILDQLITDFASYVDPTINLESFFDLVWNVDTAQGHGLDVWGRIVDVSRTLHIVLDKYFGFAEQGLTVGTFGESSFFNGSSPATNNFNLPDDQYRVLIFAKALSNISDGSIPSINQILLNLFPHRGNAYVKDNLDMSMTYRFEFILSPVELAIVTQSNVIPKPTGVSVDVQQA